MLPLVSGHVYVEPETLNAIRAAPHVLHFFSACAAILSPFLLFLMALALRLKFRMSVCWALLGGDLILGVFHLHRGKFKLWNFAKGVHCGIGQ